MGLLHDIAYGAAAVVGAPVWGVRWLREGKLNTDWSGRFGHVPDHVQPDGRPTLLIHAVSVGEVDATRQLIRQLEQQTQADWRIVISVTTDTGIARARSLFEPQHRVVRQPLDFTRCVRRFLDAVQPDLVCFIELELWPNFTAACVRRDVPMAVVNGRLSERSFERYRRIRPLVRPMFRRLDAAAVQTQAYADRFVALGTPPQGVQVTDSMKWDTAQIADHVDGAGALARDMGIDRSKPIIVAGSTGPGEEQLLIDTCPPDVQLVLVPRKIERAEQIAELVPGMIRRTQHPPGSTRPLDLQRLFLIDTIGELGKAYALADVAIVGRSFLGLYGSNVTEPIALGRPTIVGPHHSDFQQMVDALVEGGGLIVTGEPGKVAGELLRDRKRADELVRRGREVILARQGATQRHVALLTELMPASKAPAGAG